MTVNPTRRVWPLIALVVTALLAIPAVPVTYADPQADTTTEADPGPSPGPAARPGDATLPLADLGSSKDVSFSFVRNVTSSMVTFIVPPGLNPLSLNATFHTPINLRSVRLVVTQEDRSVSRLDLPGLDGTPAVVPLSGLQMTGGRMKIRLTMTAVPPDGFCLETPLLLADSKITFAGREVTPNMVATFLPTVSRKVTVVVPPKPSRAESNAAVQLAAVIAQRYGGRGPELVITARQEGPTQPPPMERIITIEEGPDTGLSLQTRGGVPALRISGSGDDLANQARLLGDSSLVTALGATATAGPLSFNQNFSEGNTTLGTLLNANGSGTEDLIRPPVIARCVPRQVSA